MRKVLFMLILFVALPAHAQFSIPGAGNVVTITMSPAYPVPNTTVELTVQSGLYDVSRSLITWTAGGKVIAGGEGATVIRVPVGALGSATQIAVEVNSPEGDASGAITVAPATVDLLWESNSYTPPFYAGRALSSAGSTVTIVAVPHLVRSGGTSVPADQIVYTWKKNGVVLTAASGKGRSSVTFEGPMLYATDSISVTAASTDGSLAAQGLLRISDTATRPVLYEDDPLFGILYHRALGNSAVIPETEMSFTAIPYFAPITRLNDPQLEYAWAVNGNPVAISATKPNEITINAARSNGIAAIALELSHSTNFFFGARGGWSITFSNGSLNGLSSGSSDPFRQ